MTRLIVLLAGHMTSLEGLRRVSGYVSLAAFITAAVPSPTTAQSGTDLPAPAPNEPASTPIDPDRLPIDIDKIQRAVTRRPAIKLETQRSVFRVEVFGRKPTIEDILGPDYLKGPAPAGGMSHQEFLNMVTPKDVQGYAAFSNKQAITVAATSLALQWALQKAIQKYNDAKEERAREAAKREVEEALAELRRARRAAGLPEK
jgi:hypothetical protein